METFVKKKKKVIIISRIGKMLLEMFLYVQSY